MFTPKQIKKVIAISLPLIIGLTALLPTATAAGQNCFTDVDAGNQYYYAICSLKADGFLEGYEDGSFKPYAPINRAEALKLISIANELHLQELPESEETNNDGLLTGTNANELGLSEPLFADVPLDAWYNEYLYPAKELGVIQGYQDGTFKPATNINLVETLKILLESADSVFYPETPGDFLFDDTDASEWYANYVAYAGMKTLLDVSPSNEVFPNQEMTRGYFATLIYRFNDRNENHEFGKATFYGKAVQGNYTASGEVFDYNKMTAAHKTLPFGTIVKVTNLANGKSIEVKINDRGPYGPGRIIDLSSKAFEEIAWLGTGVIYAQVEIVSSPE